MTIGLDRLLRHMGWANQKTIAHLESLSEESLTAFATNSEWFVAEILHHATEHRAQIASALEARGFVAVDLDELDLWSYEIETGR